MQARHGLHEAEGQGLQTLDQGSKRLQKERLKTTAVALVLCLNIGVDPPDVIRLSPCARMECWVDPMSMQAPKALETIGELWLGGVQGCLAEVLSPQPTHTG